MARNSDRFEGDFNTLHLYGRVITPVTHLFSAIYRGELTPSIPGRGPSCTHPGEYLPEVWCCVFVGRCWESK